METRRELLPCKTCTTDKEAKLVIDETNFDGMDFMVFSFECPNCCRKTERYATMEEATTVWNKMNTLKRSNHGDG